MLAGGFELRLGATYLGDGRTRFRVWAPDRRTVEVALEPVGGGLSYLPLERSAAGYFEGSGAAAPGARYRYRLDGGECFPDPCSRFQPEGPHGPSVVVDPGAFGWTDGAWRGLSRRGNVLYELHVGTFTPEGTFAGALSQLESLRELGVTAIELMPVNTFPGRFNWGYDGVGLFAPCAVYGTPDDLRRLVDRCHALGLGVLLDVVYNHLGPDGNYLRQYAKAYFSDRHRGEWGDPLNFDGPDSGPVRDFFVQNAGYWISEFHADGLRLDATHGIFDDSPRHVLAELSAAARRAGGERRVLLVAETEQQDARLLAPAASGGCELDLLWIDDFHHAARVAATGQAEAYLSDYRGTAQELLACARHNALYQGQWYAWQKKARGSPLLDVPPEQIVFYLQNHDQVANTLTGARLQELSGDAVARALACYFLLLPQTPMLFMGQEFFASAPFLYFVDHRGPLAEAVRRGRAEFMRQFSSARAALDREGAVLPEGEAAFQRSRLDWSERERHAGAYALHRSVLGLRRTDPVLSGAELERLDGAALSERALALRFFARDGADRLLLTHLGPTSFFAPCPEPLLAPPSGRRWAPLLSSEDSRFGGAGAVFPDAGGPWQLPARSTVVLEAIPEKEPR